jgi:hypothetical protein
MRIAWSVPLAFVAVLAVPTPAAAGSPKSEHSQLVCQKTGERVGGLKKTCYYDCGAWHGGRQEYVYDHCPSWTVRWRLNHDTQFGPRPRATRKTA